jgi:hypothetical protein
MISLLSAALWCIWSVFYTPIRSTNTEVFVAAVNASATEKAKAQLKCDGIQDEIEIQQAISKYKIVRLSSGTFYLSKILKAQQTQLKGKGIDITILKMSGGMKSAIVWKGQKTQVAPNNAFAQVKSDTRIIPTNFDLTTYLKAGDIISIANAEAYNGKRKQYNKGEFLTIDKINNRQITTKEPIILSYATKNTRIYKHILLDNVGMDSLSIHNAPDNNADYLALIQNAKKSYFRSVKVLGFGKPRRGLYLLECHNSEISHCIGEDIGDKSDKVESGEAERTGFAFSVDASLNCVIRHCVGKRNRHTVDASKLQWHPVCRNLRVENVKSIHDVFGLSTHGGVYEYVFQDCEVESPEDGGINCRSPKGQIIRAKIYGTILNKGCVAIRVGEETKPTGFDFPQKFGGIAGTDFTVKDTQIDLKGERITFLLATEPLLNAQVKGGYWKGADKNIFLLQGIGNQSLSVEGLTVDMQNPRKKFIPIIEAQAGDGSKITLNGKFNNLKIKNQAITKRDLFQLANAGTIVFE